MDAEGLDRPEGSPGSISIKLSADPVALMLGAPVKELIEPLCVSLTGKTQARSCFFVMGRSRPRSAIS
jgi:hypothetical protein